MPRREVRTIGSVEKRHDAEDTTRLAHDRDGHDLAATGSFTVGTAVDDQRLLMSGCPGNEMRFRLGRGPAQRIAVGCRAEAFESQALVGYEQQPHGGTDPLGCGAEDTVENL